MVSRRQQQIESHDEYRGNCVPFIRTRQEAFTNRKLPNIQSQIGTIIEDEEPACAYHTCILLWKGRKQLYIPIMGNFLDDRKAESFYYDPSNERFHCCNGCQGQHFTNEECIIIITYAFAIVYNREVRIENIQSFQLEGISRSS